MQIHNNAFQLPIASALPSEEVAPSGHPQAAPDFSLELDDQSLSDASRQEVTHLDCGPTDTGAIPILPIIQVLAAPRISGDFLSPQPEQILQTSVIGPDAAIAAPVQAEFAPQPAHSTVVMGAEVPSAAANDSPLVPVIDHVVPGGPVAAVPSEPSSQGEVQAVPTVPGGVEVGADRTNVDGSTTGPKSMISPELWRGAVGTRPDGPDLPPAHGMPAWANGLPAAGKLVPGVAMGPAPDRAFGKFGSGASVLPAAPGLRIGQANQTERPVPRAVGRVNAVAEATPTTPAMVETEAFSPAPNLVGLVVGLPIGESVEAEVAEQVSPRIEVEVMEALRLIRNPGDPNSGAEIHPADVTQNAPQAISGSALQTGLALAAVPSVVEAALIGTHQSSLAAAQEFGFDPELVEAGIASQVARVLPERPGAVILTLTPEDLGRIRFEIQQNGDLVRMVLAAERPETLDHIRHHLPEFLAELRQAGFSGSDISLGQWSRGPGDHTPPWSGAAQDDRPNRQGQGPQAWPRGGVSDAADENPIAASRRNLGLGPGQLAIRV